MFEFCGYLLCIIGPFAIVRKENYLQLNMDKKGLGHTSLAIRGSPFAFINGVSQVSGHSLFSNQLCCFINDYFIVKVLWRIFWDFEANVQRIVIQYEFKYPFLT
jgi:hypothetical protein